MVIKRSIWVSGIMLLAVVVTYAQEKPVIWKLNDLNTIGGYKTEILGTPVVTRGSYTGIQFNGVNDGLIIPAIPITSWSVFTIEVLFRPDADGPREPRFIHFQDKDDNRGTFEVRLTSDKQWYMDTFLKGNKSTKGLALIDSNLKHPAGRWYWAALQYDGKKMRSYVNGVKELEGETDFPLMSAGQIAFGMRLNKVSWFKGAISEIRFYPRVLAAGELERVK